MQTRGKPTLALRHAGGAVRHIGREYIATCLSNMSLPVNDAIVDKLYFNFSDRLVEVDARPVLVRDDPNGIERLEAAAGALLDAIRDQKEWDDIHLSIGYKFSEQGWPYDSRALVRELLILKEARRHLFEPYDPAASYHRLIQRVRDEIQKHSGNVAVHEKSRFIGFLLAVETDFPALIFPQETVDTPKGRCRYVERALAAGQHSPNTDEKQE